jgi:hypothetical protein
MGSLHHYRRSQRRAHGCRRVKKARDDTAQRTSSDVLEESLQEVSGGQMRAAVGRGGRGNVRTVWRRMREPQVFGSSDGMDQLTGIDCLVGVLDM